MNSENIQQIAHDDLSKYRVGVHQFSLPEISSFANRAVNYFFQYHSLTGLILRDAIEILCEINSHSDPDVSQLGLQALFPNLIEKLNDSFDPALCEVYDRVFAQIISFFRLLPDMNAFDETLSKFHLLDEESLFIRKRKLVSETHSLSNELPLKKILFLSRVTIGADVAITSVLMAHLKKVFPDAELVVLGSNKLHELYGGDEKVRIREINYGRGATLNSRLLSWLDVVAVVDKELEGLHLNQFCVIDPDSRLSQLGLLPICGDNANYFFFESRSFQSEGHFSLGQLSSIWINKICDAPPLSFPFLDLPEPQKTIGKFVASHLKRPIISLSFGVGGNDDKRINFNFEVELVRSLLNSYRVIVDSGFSSGELSQSDDLASVLRSEGIQVLQMTEDSYFHLSEKDFIDQQIIFWKGGIGSFASLISCSDQYLGYDSSGQHIAAALGIPVLAVFANSGSALFNQRWQPWGKAKIVSIFALDSQSSSQVNSQLVSSIIARLLL